jgi:hypothetical protein
MKEFRWVCFLLIISFIVSSCVTYEPIKIQALNPAEIKITPDIYKVVLINHANYQKQNDNLNITDASVKFDSISINQYFSGLLNSIGNSPRFQIISDTPIIVTKLYDDRFQKIDWPTIEKICNDSSADAAIVLENFQASYTPIKLNYSRDVGFYGSMQVVNNSLWKIYYPAKHDIIDDYFQKDTLYWDAEGYDAEDVNNQLPEISDAAIQSCFYAGVKYGKRIAQTWSSLSRFLMSNENSDFINAIQYVRLNKWEAAIALWKKYISSKNKKFAACACYDMAIASETYDHLDIALDWAAKSYFIKNDQFVANYISILELRKKEKVKIKAQLDEN